MRTTPVAKGPAFTEKPLLLLFTLVTFLFMFWGIALSMSDILNKHFQNVLDISKSKSGLIQLSVFGAYFIMSIPAGWFMKRYGYKAGILLGLGLFASGMLLFVPAADARSFTGFRIALFILGCGMATLETVAHPCIAALGDQRSSDRRVNFAQSFNAIGAVIGPKLGAFFLLRSGANLIPGVGDLNSVRNLYATLGLLVLLMAVLFLFVKVPPLNDPHTIVHPEPGTDDMLALNVDPEPGKKLYQHRHFTWAAIAQFFNVAAQAGTWSYFINYGVEEMGFSDETAANYMVLFMAMMAAGRFAGTWLMKFIAPNKLLAIFALANVLMCIIVAGSWGWVSFGALLAINFFFSIMFPTIFSLGLKNLGAHTQQASSFISMGVVGGAFFPFLMGLVANHDVATAYYLPILCYGVIFLYGARMYKVER